jgi:hypothetical protein
MTHRRLSVVLGAMIPSGLVKSEFTMGNSKYAAILFPKYLPELLLRQYAALSLEAVRAIYDRVLQHA